MRNKSQKGALVHGIERRVCSLCGLRERFGGMTRVIGVAGVHE
jgi:hypothetical protein